MVKVREVYNPNVPTLSKGTSLAQASSLLGRSGLGAVPVVDRADRVVGLLTEKDVIVELGRRDVPPSEILVEDVLIGRSPVIEENDDTLRCLDVMKREGVVLLPVVDRDDRLLGVVTIEDVACLAAQGTISAREVVDTLCEINRRGASGAGSSSAFSRREIREGGRGRDLLGRTHSGRLERIPIAR